MEIKTNNSGTAEITGLTDFSVFQTFDCGQCFRFNPSGGEVTGIAGGRIITLTQPSPDTLYVRTSGGKANAGKAARGMGTTQGGSGPYVEDGFDAVKYLSLDADYGAIKRDIILRFDAKADGERDETIRAAAECGRGIRILRQDPWETLISFIISQNSNIPRIKRTVEAMCEAYGEPIDGEDGRRAYAFPTPEALVGAGEDGLFALKTGFRAKYIYDAAKKVMDGEINFDEIREAPTEKASLILQSIKGVGPKVSSCALLFGFGKTDAFPIDVWIKRVLDKYYTRWLDETTGKYDVSGLGEWAGIAQQYLFYYERYVASKAEAQAVKDALLEEKTVI